MMNTKIQTQTITKESSMSERDTPAVLAYRVGELETSVKEGMKGLSDKLDILTQSFATKEDHLELVARVTKLENKENLKSTFLWVGLVASAIINIVGAAKMFGI
jgi:hypothetical protein